MQHNFLSTRTVINPTGQRSNRYVGV